MDKYEEIIAQIWEYERERIKKEIKTTGKVPDHLLDKIKKVIKRTSLNPKYEKIAITELVNCNDLLITFLMKDPKRQNVYESILKNYLSKNNINIKKIPHNGKNAYYPINGRIIKGSEIKDKPKEIKSLDFQIQTSKDELIYIVHKYTNENGGAQDNQYNDVIIQLKNLSDDVIKKVWFCLDGYYYNTKRLDELRKINPKIVIVNIDNILDFIKKNN